MKIPYIKIPVTDMVAYLAPYPAETKGEIFEAVLSFGMYQTWPALALPPQAQQAYLIVQQMIEREVKSYQKFCKEQKSKAKKLWNKKQNNDEAAALPARQCQSKQETKQKQEAKQELENISLIVPLNEGQKEKEIFSGEKGPPLPADFVDQVIARFESSVKTPGQRYIFLKHNAQNLKDILDFCDHNIPLALQTISVCAQRLQKGGVTGGYTAVCRNLPEYYDKAKKQLEEQAND